MADRQGTFSAGLTATENLFNGFHDYGTIKQNKAQLEAAKAQLDITKATVSSNLKTAFAELLFEQKNVELSARLLKRQESNLRLVNLRFEGGQENRGNLLYQQATVGGTLPIRPCETECAGRHQGARGTSRQARTDELEVAGELEAKSPPDSFNARALVKENPSHTQAYYTQVAADSGITIADQGWYPNLSATGFLGRTGSDFFPENDRWSVGVSITFPPFFPGTANIYNSQNARALKMQSEYQLTSTDSKLIAQLENAYGGLKDAIAQVKVALDFRDAAKARSIISTEKYNTGLMTFEDWSVIETDLVTREQNLLTNSRNALQAEATWEAALGRGAIH